MHVRRRASTLSTSRTHTLQAGPDLGSERVPGTKNFILQTAILNDDLRTGEKRHRHFSHEVAERSYAIISDCRWDAAVRLGGTRLNGPAASRKRLPAASASGRGLNVEAPEPIRSR